MWPTILLDRISEAYRYLNGGGVLMIPLAAVSVWMWVLIFKKAGDIHAFRKEESIASVCLNFPNTLSGDSRGWPVEVAQDFLAKRNFIPSEDRKLLHSIISRHGSALDRHVTTILVLASVAPLLGLLATVNGMITSFEVLARLGTGSAKHLAAGISEALITTQSGLAVAIPGLLAGNLIRRGVERCRIRMERFEPALLRRFNPGESLPKQMEKEKRV